MQTMDYSVQAMSISCLLMPGSWRHQVISSHDIDYDLDLFLVFIEGKSQQQGQSDYTSSLF